MKYSTNYNMNKPELNEQYRLEHWNNNTDIIDTELKRNADNIETAETALRNITDSTFKTALLNFCYPVGSLYWSSSPTDPATLFGGTWTRIKDRFVLAAGDTYGNGSTGGSATVRLTESSLPAHSHICNSVDISHTHDMSHGHDGSVSGTVGTTDTNHTHHVYNVMTCNNPSGGIEGFEEGNSWETAKTFIPKTIQSSGSIEGVGMKHSHTWSGSVSIDTLWQSTGGMSTNSSHSHIISGGGSGTASGNAHENMPPYIVKFCWERTA